MNSFELIALVHLLVILTRGSNVSSCGSTNFTEDCVRAAFGDGGAVPLSVTECANSICELNASLSSECAADVNTTVRDDLVVSAQTSCSAYLEVDVGDAGGNATLHPTAVASSSQWEALNGVLRRMPSSLCASVSSENLNSMRGCLDGLNCRRKYDRCSPECLYASLTCVLSYLCDGGYVAYSLNASQCVSLLPVDFLVCKQRNESLLPAAFCAAAVARLTASPDKTNFFQQYSVFFAIGIGALAFIVVVSCVALVVARRMKAPRARSSSHENSESDERPEATSPAVLPRSRPTSLAPYSRPQETSGRLVDKQHHPRRSRRVAPGAEAPRQSQTSTCVSRDDALLTVMETTAADEFGVDTWVPDANEFDPPTIVDRRPVAAKSHVQLEWSYERNGWARPISGLEQVSRNAATPKQRKRLSPTYDFVESEDDGSVEAAQPLAPWRSGSSEGDVPPNAEGLQQDAMGLHGAQHGNLSRRHGAVGSEHASLGELEFAFDSASGNNNNNEDEDAVVPMDELSRDGSMSGVDSPTNSADGDTRLVYEQESLRSSIMASAALRDEIVAAGNHLSRKEILSSIVGGRFIRGRLLGRGTGGCVYQMVLQDTHLCVAMKEVDVQRCTRDELSKIIGKYNFLMRLSHRYLTELYLVRYDPGSLALNVWMEFVGGGMLLAFAKQFKRYPPDPDGVTALGENALAEAQDPRATAPHRGIHAPSHGRPPLAVRRTTDDLSSSSTVPTAKDEDFPEHVAVVFVSQLLSALSFLHKKGVIHRDIKGSNILLTPDRKSIKIVDYDCCHFDASRVCGGGRRSSATSLPPPGQALLPSVLSNDPPSVAGSPLWMPPEVLLSKCAASPSTDVWSVGITTAEILLGGAVPWPAFETTFAAMVHITKGHPPQLRRVNLSEQAQDFLRRCWAPDPALRSSAIELRSHPWLQRSRPSSFRRSSNATSFTNGSVSARSSAASASALAEPFDEFGASDKHFKMEEELRQLEEEIALW